MTPISTVTMLRAMYEYTAQYMEELTFPEGALIELIRMDDNGVDDGWWEGRYQGKVGVFPSVVVETITNGMVSYTFYTLTYRGLSMSKSGIMCKNTEIYYFGSVITLVLQ